MVNLYIYDYSIRNIMNTISFKKNIMIEANLAEIHIPVLYPLIILISLE